jgi:hypothetical protein
MVSRCSLLASGLKRSFRKTRPTLCRVNIFSLSSRLNGPTIQPPRVKSYILPKSDSHFRVLGVTGRICSALVALEESQDLRLRNCFLTGTRSTHSKAVMRPIKSQPNKKPNITITVPSSPSELVLP